MAKRCFGITKNFKRCTNERMLIPVCQKHVWQFIQLMVVIVTIGAILVTLELYHVYEKHLHEIQQKQTHNEAVDTAKNANKNQEYEKWDE